MRSAIDLRSSSSFSTNVARLSRVAAHLELRAFDGDCMTKISVSLPDKTLERAKIAVKHGRAPNVSSYIASHVE